MARRKFDDWLKTLRASISSYKYYTDFEKVYANVDNIKKELFLLYSLIGSKDIEKDFRELVTEYPKCLNAIPILIAIRDKKIFCEDEKGKIIYRFDEKVQTLDQYVYFMRETGLFGMLVNPQRSSLYDYVTGVEVGMDSHSRKGRSGKKMEYLVESFIKATGKEYYYQMTLSQIKRKWHMDFSAITPRKKFDFVVKTDNCVYAIEVNFYNNDGSKQTETARSYMMLAEESKSINNFKFVWITDGGGWLKSRNSLEEAFNVLDDLYNIADMEHGILKKIFV